MSVAVLDYGMGNLRSVVNALESLEVEAYLAPAPEAVDGANSIVIPGVGAFGDGMEALREHGFVEMLAEKADAGMPILGICLGMQLLAARGTEYGEHEGLGLIAGTVTRIDPGDGLRVPHVGWNVLKKVNEASPLLSGLADDATCYFVHSYEFVPEDDASVTGVTPYGRDLVAVVEQGNVFGTQFHPEKSQRDGLRILANFAALESPC